MKRFTFVSLCLVLLFSLVLSACGGSNSGTKGNDSSTPKSDTNQPSSDAGKDEQITIKFFTALADRTNGPGKVEQQLIDAYMAENPNVKIEVEALQDEPYKNKIKVYASTSSLPDIIQSWGQSSFIRPLIDNDLLLELDPNDFANANFVPGSVDGFSQDGKWYGLPRGADYFVLFYNKKIFADHGVTPPTTVDELLDVVSVFRDKGINPIASAGMDGWPLPIWFEYVQQRISGDFNLMDDALERRASFTDPVFLEAAQFMQDFAKAGAFADGHLTADYGTARNLFGQQQAAMFLMGNWEAGLATDESFSEEFRENVGAIPYPGSGSAKTTDTAAWYGGGYSVSKHTEHPEVVIDFLKFFFEPEHWAKILWEEGAGTPAQVFDEFLTGNETELQKELVDIFSNITSSSGTPVLDSSTEQFKTAIMDLHQQLLSSLITPEEFVAQLDAAAEEAAAELANQE